MNFMKALPVTPVVRPQYNIGCLFDIPTGIYHKGRRGEHVLMGGYGTTNSITGPGNSFKSDYLLFQQFSVLNRYPSSRGNVYDTENSLTYARLNRVAAAFKNLRDLDIEKEMSKDDPKVTLTQKADLAGDAYFEIIKEMAKEKQKARKSIKQTLPINDHNDEPVVTMIPHLMGIDSLSAFGVSAVQEKIVDKNAIGESGGNTLFMRDGAAKTQLILQLPNLCVNGDIYVGMTAHVGNTIEMDPYAPKPIKLAFTKSGTKQKGVPEKFQFINTHLIEVYNTKPLVHPTDKGPLYPKVDADREKGNDLFIITSVNSRNKGGPSGVTFPIVVSQAEGILASLTEFHYIKEVGKRFGIGGNNTTFHLDLCPDINLGRTTVRNKIEENEEIQRALEITSEMLQMQLLWRGYDEDLFCTPKELYDDLTEMGYDWKELLATRGWWLSEEDEKIDTTPFLSTMDLLEMRRGNYVPFWMDVKTKRAK